MSWEIGLTCNEIPSNKNRLEKNQSILESQRRRNCWNDVDESVDLACILLHPPGFFGKVWMMVVLEESELVLQARMLFVAASRLWYIDPVHIVFVERARKEAN